MSKKREVVVHCQLSRRQQAMYTAIRRKICISDLLRGHDSTVSDKRMLNLMNLVIQLRKACALACKGDRGTRHPAVGQSCTLASSPLGLMFEGRLGWAIPRTRSWLSSSGLIQGTGV